MADSAAAILAVAVPEEIIRNLNYMAVKQKHKFIEAGIVGMVLVIIPTILFIYPALWPLPLDIQLHDAYYVFSPFTSFLYPSVFLLFIVYSIKEAFYQYNRPFQNFLLIVILFVLGWIILHIIVPGPNLENSSDKIVSYLSYFYYIIQTIGLFLAYKIGRNTKEKPYKN